MIIHLEKVQFYLRIKKVNQKRSNSNNQDIHQNIKRLALKGYEIDHISELRPHGEY